MYSRNVIFLSESELFRVFRDMCLCVVFSFLLDEPRYMARLLATPGSVPPLPGPNSSMDGMLGSQGGSQ